MNLSPTLPSSLPNADVDERLRELLARHFHPEWGSAYWLQRQAQLGWQVCERVRTRNDLWLLGPTPTADLRRFPIQAFIPKALHKQRSRFIVAETAGTNGDPCGTAYRDDEFQAAFIDPFLYVAQATGLRQYAVRRRHGNRRPPARGDGLLSLGRPRSVPHRRRAGNGERRRCELAATQLPARRDGTGAVSSAR